MNEIEYGCDEMTTTITFTYHVHAYTKFFFEFLFEQPNEIEGQRLKYTSHFIFFFKHQNTKQKTLKIHIARHLIREEKKDTRTYIAVCCDDAQGKKNLLVLF